MIISHQLPQDQLSLAAYGQSVQNSDLKSEELLELGMHQLERSLYPEALQSFQTALQSYQGTDNRKAEADALLGTGYAYNGLGKYQTAIDFYNRSLAIRQKIGDTNGAAHAINGLGYAYNGLGQYQKSLELHQQALATFKQSNDQSGMPSALNGIADVYGILNQPTKAIDFYQQSLAIAQKSKNLADAAYALNGLGDVYEDLEQYQKAIDSHQQSLVIFRQIENRDGEAYALYSLGSAYTLLEQVTTALNFYQQSLAIFREIGNRNGEAYVLNGLGYAYGIQGSFPQAFELFQQTVTIARQVGDRYNEGYALENLGLMFTKTGQTEVAILFYKQAVNVRESIRQDIRKLPKKLQKSYLSTIEDSYRTLADLLLKQERIIEALQVLDFLKVQELEDYLKNVRSNALTSQGVRFLAPEKAMINELWASNYQQIKSLNSRLAKQIEQLPKSEIDQAPAYLQKLPQGTALLYPLIIEDRIEIILFANGIAAMHRASPIKKAELQKLIQEFQTGLRDYSSQDFREPSQRLYNLLIKPVEADLKANQTKTILYAPDGILRYIPLAALYDGKQFLIENYTINNLIAYILMDFINQDQTDSAVPRVLAGAFGGQLGEQKFNQIALPATIIEVSAITRLIPNSIAFTNNEFSIEAINSQLSKYTILHLATHASFNTGTPENSFIIFGSGQTIHLNEISNLNLGNLKLIILSACETAIGKIGNGVEILGFGYQVQKAGAKSAIASLWQVSDEGTQKLMQGFYGYLKLGNYNKADALRQSQIDLIRGQKFSHPFYWAAFVLIGNGL
ncbi:MAG: CHAT domain-containing protein [Pseudanabaena sp. ELA607]